MLQVDFRTSLKKENLKKYGKYFLIFCLYFIVQYKFLNAEWFGTDELDVMMGGKSISSGYLLYGDFFSQHMPFSYYLSAIFDFFGAKSVPSQRMAFYGFYALMWTIINVRYRNRVNRKVLFAYPLIFSCVICCYDFGTVILSEQLAGIGFVILYLELLVFLQSGKLNYANYVFLSLAVILTFGTTFISAFGVFVVAVAVLMKEIQWAREKQQGFRMFLAEMCKKYIPLFVTVGLPWAVLMVYYLVNGVLGKFILQAYTLNRVAYPKYIGGVGESIAETLLGSIEGLVNIINGLVSLNNLSVVNFIYIVMIALFLLYLCNLVKHADSFLCVTTIALLLAMGTRGYFNFHGTQCVALLSLIAAEVLFDILIVDKKTFFKKSNLYQLVIISVLVIVAVPYFRDTKAFATNTQLFEVEDPYMSVVLENITEEDEAVWQINFSNYLVMYADRPTMKNLAAVPWFWEAVGIETLGEISADMPRVALYDVNHEVWGYKQSEYAPELAEFMQEHYHQYNDTEIYIRNDYYDEAVKIIDNAM